MESRLHVPQTGGKLPHRDESSPPFADFLSEWIRKIDQPGVAVCAMTG